MAYIVDFTTIMQVIFGLVVNAQLRLSRRLIKLAFATSNNSVERVQVHNEIRDHVKSAGRANRDAALAKTLQLIKDHQMKTEDMDKLQLVMGGVDNGVDEPRTTLSNSKIPLVPQDILDWRGSSSKSRMPLPFETLSPIPMPRRAYL